MGSRNEKTPNLGLPLDTMGHIPLQRTVEDGFKTLDEKFPGGGIPAFAVGDIGKVLGIVDDGDGNPILGWVTP